MKFRGLVAKVTKTSDGHQYAVIEIENSINLNYRLFVPTGEFKTRQHVTVYIETEQQKAIAQRQIKEKEKMNENSN